MAAGERSAPCACPSHRRRLQPGLSIGKLLRGPWTRNWSLAVDVLRFADRDRHARAPPAEVELAARIGPRRLSHAEVPAGEGARFPARATCLAEPILGLGGSIGVASGGRR